jgi:hypothetical protein
MAIRRFSNASITSAGGKSSKFWDQETSLGTFESIAVAIGDNATYLAFTNIPQTYKHLQIRGVVRDDVAALTQDPLYLRFNGDAGNNYAWHQLLGNGSTAVSNNTINTSLIQVGKTTGGNSAADIYGAIIIDILDYTSISKNKTVRSLSGNDQNGSGEIGLFSGVWFPTTPVAVTQINMGVSNYYDSTKTMWSLYGIRG